MDRGKLYSVVLSVILPVIFVGCYYYGYEYYYKSKIKVGVGEDLKDPESVLLYDVEFNSNGACGYYNAKNSYGAYVGKKFFYGTFIGDKFYKKSENDISIYTITQCENMGLKVR